MVGHILEQVGVDRDAFFEQTVPTVLMWVASMADNSSEHQLNPCIHTHQFHDSGQVIKMCWLGWFHHILSSPIYAQLDAPESWSLWTITSELPCPLDSSGLDLWDAWIGSKRKVRLGYLFPFAPFLPLHGLWWLHSPIVTGLQLLQEQSSFLFLLQTPKGNSSLLC